MAAFEACACTLTIEPHPNADRIEVARIQGYQTIVPKGRYRTGDVAVFLPPDALVPADVVAELGLTGKLAGKASNRVKPIRLRGVLSEGLIYPVDGARLAGRTVRCGDDLTEAMGVVKYEPPIPSSLDGEVESRRGETMAYDIEPWKRYPDWFEAGEPVAITEKIHGTLCCLARIAADPERDLVTSKGLGAQGLAFKLDAERNRTNAYVRMFHRHRDLLDALCERVPGAGEAVHVFAEIHGDKIQDLRYGLQRRQEMAIFDIHVGRRGHGRYLDHAELRSLADLLPLVPLLYEGPYSEEVVRGWTDGKTTLGGGHVREGIVIRPMVERQALPGERLILKSVSADYLTRPHGTEHN